MASKPKVGIIGGGAVGLTYAGFLSEVAEVILKTRSQDQADVINSQGIELVANDAKQDFKNISATADMTAMSDCDALIIAVKSYDTETVAKQLSQILKPKTTVVTLQNGLLSLDILRAEINNPDRVLGGVTYIAGRRSHGRSVSLGQNRRTILDNRAELLINLLQQTKFNVETTDDINQAVWDKMVLNNGQNALSALTNLPVGDMLKSKDCLNIAGHLMDEFQQVAAAAGITFDYAPMEKLKDNWKGINFYPSMWQDLHNRSRTEIDAINGAIGTLGKKHNIPTPYNDMVTSLIKILETTKNLPHRSV